MPGKKSQANKSRRGMGDARAARAPGVSPKDLSVSIAAQHGGGKGPFRDGRAMATPPKYQLLTVAGVMSREECAEWVAFAEGLGMISTRPPGGKPARGTACE